MNNLTREHIIDLINQYIYTNGNQSITAAQLHEILLEIANAFALEGGGGPTGGIDAVLATGNQVTEGRTIANETGGSVLLAASTNIGDRSYDYMGLDVSVPQHQGFVYNSETQLLLGNLKRLDPARGVFNMLSSSLGKGELMTFTNYVSEPDNETYEPGIYSVVRDAKYTTAQYTGLSQVNTSVMIGNEMGASQTLNSSEINHIVKDTGGFTTLNISSNGATINTEQTEEIYTQVYAIRGEAGSRSGNGTMLAQHVLRPDSIEAEIINGPQTSRHIQGQGKISTSVINGPTYFDTTVYNDKQYWSNHLGSIAEMSGTGLSLQAAKVLELNPPSGVNKVTLSAGARGGNMKVNGTGTFTTEATTTVLKSNQINFNQDGTDYASFSSTSSSLNSPFTLNSATYSSAFSSTHSTPGGSNIAVYASAINGITNTAVFAESGNVVIKNGSAMIGFDDGDMTPNARLDIQAQGIETPAIRVRNAEDSANIMEVRSDGNVLMGSISSTSGSNVLHIAKGSAPDTSSEDGIKFYSDTLDGGDNLVPHFLTGKGQIIRLYQQNPDIGDAEFASKKGVTLTDTDTYNGFTLKQVVRALINLGILK